MCHNLRCSTGTTDTTKHSSLRVKKAHIVTLSGIAADDKSSSESLNFGKILCYTMHFIMKQKLLMFSSNFLLPCVFLSSIRQVTGLLVAL